MAKPEADQAGSSCHIHLSLWFGDDNAFTGDNEIGPIRCSDTFTHFLGGWMNRVYDVMPFLAPTWSFDNRTAGFRVVGAGPSLRIECRIPGADVNPYLAYTAALAAGIDGIDNEAEPPEMFTGDVYAAQDLDRVPETLTTAIPAFAQSAFVREAIGDDVREHYAHFFSVEAAAYDAAVTDWERSRYFDRI